MGGLVLYLAVKKGPSLKGPEGTLKGHEESERPSHAYLGGKSTAGLKEQLRSFSNSELGMFKE